MDCCGCAWAAGEPAAGGEFGSDGSGFLHQPQQGDVSARQRGVAGKLAPQHVDADREQAAVRTGIVAGAVAGTDPVQQGVSMAA
jgi:hypothetical protein